jgi:hypothetical protein
VKAKEKKRRIVGFKVTDEEYELLEKLCKAEHRSKSGLIVHLLHAESDRYAQET